MRSYLGRSHFMPERAARHHRRWEVSRGRSTWQQGRTEPRGHELPHILTSHCFRCPHWRGSLAGTLGETKTRPEVKKASWRCGIDECGSNPYPRNRRMRTRMYGGVAGDPGRLGPLCRFLGSIPQGQMPTSRRIRGCQMWNGTDVVVTAPRRCAINPRFGLPLGSEVW